MASLRRILQAAVAIAVLVIGWTFAAANSESVRVSLLFGEALTVPLWTALVAGFAAGALVCGVWSGIKLAQLSLLSRRYRRAVQRLEGEVQQLRNLPLASDAPAATAGGAREGDAPGGAQEASGRAVLS